ncbi:MAG: methyltransferase domain-containing protein, partial [Candidatus Thorarchaeota archaeon]
MNKQGYSGELKRSSEQKQAIRRAFGALAQFYDVWYDTPLGKYVWSVEATAIRELLPEKMGEIIIDVGVGTGMSLSVLRDFLGHFIGVDIAWQMIEKARQKTKNFIKSHLVLAD